MSLIMDALEKVQREKERAAAPFPLEPENKFQPVFDKEPVYARPLVPVFLFLSLGIFVAAFCFFQKTAPQTALNGNPAAAPAAILRNNPAPGVLRGIVRDPAGNFCLIGDQILRQGDIWRGYQILSIEAQQVTLQNTGNPPLTLQLQG